MSGFGGFGSSPNTGFNFGVNKTTPTTTTMASTPNMSGGSFQLGTPQTSAATGITFGTPSFGGVPAASSTPSFNFGAPKAAAPTGLTLGALAAPAAAGGFNFGTTPATSATAGFTLGAPTTSTPSLGLSFGQPGANTAPSTDLSFSLPKTSAPLSFGAPPATTASFGFNLGGIPVTTSIAAPNFSFNLGSASSGLGTGGGLFGAKTTGNISLSTATTTTSIGLGGIDNSQVKKGLSGVGANEPKAVKDNTLPDPLLQILSDFQAFIKQQKSISVEISHGSSKTLKKVQEDTQALKSLLSTINSGLTRNWLAVEKLKNETAQGLHQAEMAQRLHDAPPGLHYDNIGTTEYFIELVAKFEEDTIKLRVQMENSEKHLQSFESSSSLSPQELTLAMRRLHDTLVVLAARVQSLHTSVQTRKEHYRNLHRVYLKDDVEPIVNFRTEGKKNYSSLHSLTGPTSFCDAPLPVHLNVSTGIASGGVWSSSLGNNSFSTSLALPSSSLPVENAGFQLAKPPLGNKRNKR